MSIIWIINHNEATGGLYNADFMDEAVEFSSNGTAQVSERLGRRMIEEYDLIEEYEREVDEDEESDADEE